MSQEDYDFQVNKQFYEGKVVTLDNYLNTVLETDNGLKFIKGSKIAFMAIKNNE